jgi:hypothetical protein
MFVIKHRADLIIGIVFFVTVKSIVEKVITHTYWYIYYKNHFDQTNHPNSSNINRNKS